MNWYYLAPDQYEQSQHDRLENGVGERGRHCGTSRETPGSNNQADADVAHSRGSGHRAARSDVGATKRPADNHRA